MKDFKILTISNRRPSEWYYTYDQLFRSAGDNEILVLGQEPGAYTGLSDKPRILHKAISDGLIKERYIVFVDAWDVVFADTLEGVMEKYQCFNAPIVVGAEKNCFPACFKKEYDRLLLNTSYKYLNSGVIIGYTDAIYEVLEAMDAPNLPVDYHDQRNGHNYHFNDQAYYADIFLRQPVHMRLDHTCFITQNMQDVAENELCLSGPEIVNTETGTSPSIIHWNGASKDKWSREQILKKLNLL